MKNNQRDWQSQLNHLVYSTGSVDGSGFEAPEADNVPPSEQVLRIWLEKKGRGGKQATLVKGFSGNEESLKELSTQLKKHCGTGGSIKDQEIIIQGDQRIKVRDFLISKGYTRTKLAGG